LNMGAQLQTYPYPMVSKLFLNSNDFKTKSCTQILSFKARRTQASPQKRDAQTNQHTGRPGGGWNQSPTNLAHWQRTSSTFLHLQNICDPMYSFAARGRWTLGKRKMLNPST